MKTWEFNSPQPAVDLRRDDAVKKVADYVSGFLFGLAYVIPVLFAIGVVAYVVDSDFGKQGESSGFQLATISSVIGGLILATGFLDRAQTPLRTRLRRIGVFYLVATISFVVYGISFPVIENEFVRYVAAIGMLSGALAFALGTCFLVRVIPALWSSAK